MAKQLSHGSSEASDWLLATLIFSSVVSSTLLIPILRPFFANSHPDSEWAMHAFMSVNMLGGILGAPMLGAIADRVGQRRQMIVGLAVLDGIFLIASTLPLSVYSVLVARTLQGAVNIGGLSILLGLMAGRASVRSGRTMGLAGAAMMLAVAAGSPLGTLLLELGPVVAMRCAGLIPLVVAVVCAIVALPRRPPARHVTVRSVLRDAPLLKLPVAWVSVERFVVGCFVVTFALYAHRALGLSDSRIGLLFSCFLMPFALATYPMGRLAERFNRAGLIGIGMVVYGVSFLALGLVPAPLLPAIMVAAGLASAAIYAPCLCYASSLVAPEVRTTSMSLLNAGGSLGMMLGTALGGVVSAGLLSAGYAADFTYPAVFVGAGLIQLLTLSLSIRGLRALATRGGAKNSPRQACYVVDVSEPAAG